MGTIDGKKPSSKKIEDDSVELENKINKLIQEFRDIYNEPAIIIENSSSVYKMNYTIYKHLLYDQYRATDPIFASHLDKCDKEFEAKQKSQNTSQHN